jgi:uncharacterized protein (DUF2141 family)
MLRRLLLSLMLPLLTACTHAPSSSLAAHLEGPYSLKVSIKVPDDEGFIKIALYNSSSTWLEPGLAVRARVLVPSGADTQMVFYGLPAGQYAIAAFQDTNNNQKLDKKWFVLPKEPYGFSNDTGRRGPASFKKSIISIPATQETQIILRSL